MRPKLIVSIVLLGFVVAAGCAKKADDAALVTNIKAQMFSDARLRGANLQVTSSHGAVTLSGTVPSDAARLDAYKMASQTAGVTKVNDQMMVDTSSAAQANQNPQQQQAQNQLAPETESQPVTENGPPKTPGSAASKPEHRHKVRAKLASEMAKADQAQPETVGQQPAALAPPPQIPDQPAPPPAIVSAPAPAPPPPPRQVQIAAGTTVSIRMIDDVDSSVNKPGEIFHAALDAPVVVDNDVAVPKGADVYVRLASSSTSGHMTGRSELHLELVKLEFQGQSYPLVSSTYSVTGSSRGKDTAKKVGAGAVLGTLIGAIGGGGKGAGIGAAAGAAAGGVYQAATRGKQVKVPSETKLDFELEQPVTVTVMPHSASPAQ
jgi:BON domain